MVRRQMRYNYFCLNNKCFAEEAYDYSRRC